ncbi:SPOR domain-containing protein [Haliea sp. E17]|uniref:SPOR domain-containing protein n=1 Tax=Haliea sp. E17 TaxID=3401576 RepID=UPI003AAF47AC
MKRYLLLKYLISPVVVLIMARGSYGYELPGDPPESDQRTLVPIDLDFTDNPVHGRIANIDSDAATLKYNFSQIKGLAISSSYSNRLLDPFSSDGDVDMDGFWDIRLSSPRTDSLPGIEIDFSAGGFNGETGTDFADPSHQRIRVKTSSKLGAFDYGSSYQVVGTDYEVVDKNNKIKEKDRNRATTNSWIGRSFGKLHISQFTEQKRNNIDESRQPQVTDSLYGTSLRYTLLSWPYVGTSFSYASGDRESEVVDVGITSLNGGLSASHNNWNVDLYISRTSPEDNAGNYFGQARDTNYYLGGSYYPNKRLVISPSINRNVQNYQDWGVESETLSTAVSVMYRPRERDYSFNIYVSQDSQEAPEWGVETEYFYSEAGIQWDLRNNNLLALTFGYNRYDDKIYSGSDSDDFSVKISFKSYALDRILNSRTVTPYSNQRQSYRSYQQEQWLEMERHLTRLQSVASLSNGQAQGAPNYARDLQRSRQLMPVNSQQEEGNPSAQTDTTVPASEPAPKDKSAATSTSSQWFVNFGSFSDLENAKKLEAQLDLSCEKVSVTAITLEGRTLYRVQVTGFDTKLEAKALAQRIEENLNLGTLWVGKG